MYWENQALSGIIQKPSTKTKQIDRAVHTEKAYKKGPWLLWKATEINTEMESPCIYSHGAGIVC